LHLIVLALIFLITGHDPLRSFLQTVNPVRFFKARIDIVHRDTDEMGQVCQRLQRYSLPMHLTVMKVYSVVVNSMISRDFPGRISLSRQITTVPIRHRHARTSIRSMHSAQKSLQKNLKKLTLAERSGMGNTRDVLEERGVFALAKKKGFSVVVLDEPDRTGWTEIQDAGLHWSRGFFLASVFARADRVVQTCCLKTPRFGGHFTLLLKNPVGCIARRVPGVNYDFMGELHSSPHQRQMIAEINKFCRTDLIVMDAADGFTTGGPDKGKLIRPNVIIAGTDRVAINAAGVALLRSYGTMRDVAGGRIFELEQIARAAELGIGISSAAAIHLVPLDPATEAIASKIQVQLDAER